MASKITTSLQPDDPVVIDAKFQYDAADRRNIDNGILGAQQHLASSLLNGTVASWYTVDVSSGTLVQGDVLCTSGSAVASMTVVKATTTNLLAAGGVVGVALTSALPGTKIQAGVAGVISPLITGVTAGSNRYARVSTLGRVESVSSLSGSDTQIGTLDAAGNLSVVRGAVGSGGAPTGAAGGFLTATYPAPGANFDASSSTYSSGRLPASRGGVAYVDVVATSNVTQSGTQTIDGVSATVGMKILCVGQSTASQNRIKVVASGAWTDAAETDESADFVANMQVHVAQGSAGRNSSWRLITTGPYTLGTTSLQWGRIEDIVSVKQFGAKGDCQSVSVGITATATQTQFTAPTSTTFNASDIGKSIELYGCGAMTTVSAVNYPGSLATTITSVSGTTIGIADAIVTSVPNAIITPTTGAAWGTDDTVALQAAMDAANSTHLQMFFPPGTYVVSGSGISTTGTFPIRGVMVGLSTLRYIGTGSSPTILKFTGGNGYDFSIENLSFQCNQTHFPISALVLQDVAYFEVNRVHFYCPSNTNKIREGNRVIGLTVSSTFTGQVPPRGFGHIRNILYTAESQTPFSSPGSVSRAIKIQGFVGQDVINVLIDGVNNLEQAYVNIDIDQVSNVVVSGSNFLQGCNTAVKIRDSQNCNIENVQVSNVYQTTTGGTIDIASNTNFDTCVRNISTFSVSNPNIVDFGTCYPSVVTNTIAVRPSVYGSSDPGAKAPIVVPYQSDFSVRAFGAYGDNSTDDTAAIQGCINYASYIAGLNGVGARVFFPRGYYKLTAALTLPSSIVVDGEGPGITIIRQATSATDVITVTDANYWSVKNMTLNAQTGGSAGHGIRVTTSASDVNFPTFENLEISGFGSSSAGIFFDPLATRSILFPVITNCRIDGGVTAPSVSSRSGIRLGAGSSGSTNDIKITNGRISNVKYGVNVGVGNRINSLDLTLDNISDGASGGTGLYLAANAIKCRFFGLVFTNTVDLSFQVAASSCQDNTFWGNLDNAGGGASTSFVDSGTRTEWYGLSGSGAGSPVNKLGYPVQLTLGTGGTLIKKHLSVTGTWDPASTANGASATTNITVTGAAVGDAVQMTLSTLTAGWTTGAVVTATNNVAVTIGNMTGGTVDLGSGTLRIDVWQH